MNNFQTSAKSNGNACYLQYYHCILVLLRTLILEDVAHCRTCDFINNHITNMTLSFITMQNFISSGSKITVYKI